MNDQSTCARWRANHWDCAILDSLIEPTAFNPPVSNGHAVLSVMAFHRDYPGGRTFERAALGTHWTRTS